MRYEELKRFRNSRNRSGIILLITLVLLVVLSILGYTLSSRLAARRHRWQYVVDYQAARYGCNSAVKYALATLEEISPKLISRPNEPDFSDLFHLDEEQYQELLDEAARIAMERAQGFGDMNDINAPSEFESISDINDINDIDDINDFNDMNDVGDFIEPNAPVIRGPYGPPWPLVTEPAEFEIGTAKVRIEIEDENAKYPIGWMVLEDELVRREIEAGFKTFCEWMDVNEFQIDSIQQELKEIEDIKSFRLEFKEKTERTPIRTGPKSGRTPGRSGGKTAVGYRKTTVSVSQQIATQAADFSKLLHCSLIDAEALARPTIVSESRKESLLKYTGMWGSRKVNVNTAPRHVLEAAFAFGGDADKIAEEIIQRRRTKPFADLTDLTDSLFRYSDSVRKCEKYITTVSTFFTVRVTTVSGVAEASAIIAVVKDGGETRKVAVISG